MTRLAPAKPVQKWPEKPRQGSLLSPFSWALQSLHGSKRRCVHVQVGRENQRRSARVIFVGHRVDSEMNNLKQAACVCGRWPERFPGLADLSTSAADLGCSAVPFLERQFQIAFGERNEEFPSTADVRSCPSVSNERWRSSLIAPQHDIARRRFPVTHPFHPLLLCYRIPNSQRLFENALASPFIRGVSTDTCAVKKDGSNCVGRADGIRGRTGGPYDRTATSVSRSGSWPSAWLGSGAVSRTGSAGVDRAMRGCRPSRN